MNRFWVVFLKEVKWIWLNGSLVPWADAKVHFLTHALHYGSAVFEGIRCYDTGKWPAVFRLKDHVARLFYSAEVFKMEIPYSQTQAYNAVIDTVKANKLRECYIRPIAFYGYGQMGLNPIGAKVDFGVAAWPWGAYLGKEGIEKGVSMRISSWVRPPTNVMPTNAKVSGNYVNSILAKVEAIRTGFEEAILLDNNGNVAECTGENIFIVRNGALITPPTDNTLKGITRDSIMQIARDLGIEVREKLFKKEELYAADEAFVTGTAAEITPIRTVDNKQIGFGKPGPITKKLMAKYGEVIHGKDKQYEKWLDYVK
ncbi:MAG: branched-chain amino acid transaminase [Candidatus Diapherotrites archaeon]|nr:branched-chain amino acid transaminase [Candidatus Diapherotrites archaeon]